MTTATPQVPALVTLPGIELVAAGTWDLSTGPATFTKADLAAAIDAAQCPNVGAPIIKIGHDDPRFTPGDGEPAIGRVINMGLAAEGNKITGDLAGMPGWLGDIAPSAYPQRSIEGSWDFVCQIGHVHPFVITAVALLGTVGPGVGVLEDLGDVAALYGVAAAAHPRSAGERWTLRAAVGGSVSDPVKASGTTTEDVRRSYYATAPYTQWITEIQLDPPQLIVCDDVDAAVYRVPYEAGANGEVTFGDPVKVLVEYVDAPADAAAASAMKAAVAAGFRALVTAAKADPEQQKAKADAKASAETPAPMPEPPAPVEAGGPHGSFTGTHAHAHSAGGSQGDDDSHVHEHSHDGDATHSHEHASAAASTKGAGVDFTADQLKALRDKLGKGDDDEITPDELVEAFTAEAKAGRRAALPPGAMVVEASAWDDLQKRVAAGEKREVKRQIEERDQVIAAAVRDGKFAPVRAEHWARLWNADPEGTREVLASLQKNVVPLSDIGAAGSGNGLGDVDEEYAAVFGNPAKG
jgi:hypothetical protein